MHQLEEFKRKIVTYGLVLNIVVTKKVVLINKYSKLTKEFFLIKLIT